MKTVTVKGVGKASAPVDTVELSFHIWAKDKRYDKALEAADQKVSALETALRAVGFPAEDFQTVGFHVNTEYESVPDEKGNYRTVFSGYNCSYDQLLRFGFDAARLGEALAAVADSQAQPELQVQVQPVQLVPCHLFYLFDDEVLPEEMPAAVQHESPIAEPRLIGDGDSRDFPLLGQLP